MPFLPLSDIKIDSRFREDFGDIKELSNSIKTFGLLHPIIVRGEDHALIAGERRYRACKELNYKEIEVRFLEDVDELLSKEIELEENIARKNFTWQEEVQAKSELDEIKRERHGSGKTGRGKDGWSLRDTAKELKQSLGSVSMDIQLAEGLKKYPELAKEKTKSKAYNKLKSIRERELRTALTNNMDLDKAGEAHEYLILGDALEEIAHLPDESVDLIWTDPPWGVNIQNSQAGSRSTFYDDMPEDIRELFKRILPEFWRVLKPETHLYFVFSMQNYSFLWELLESIGFKVDPIPLIGDKGSGGAGISSFRYSSSYSPVLFAQKPPLRELNNGSGQKNVFSLPRIHPDKRYHPAENSVVPIMAHIENSTEPGGLVLDPFGGSGSTIEAALRVNRKAIGFEKDPSHYSAGLERLTNFLGGLV